MEDLARVTAKTDLRHYSSSRGPGKVFSFDLLDGQGGEIRATCFNAQADQFFDLIEVDKVYLISNGSVKPALKNYNSLNHEYEITLDNKTSIEVCVDDDSNIPRQEYNFRQISEIENIEAGVIVDLIGIVTSVGPSAIVMRKDGTQAQKRTLQLKDMSVRSMEISSGANSVMQRDINCSCCVILVQTLYCLSKVVVFVISVVDLWSQSAQLS